MKKYWKSQGISSEEKSGNPVTGKRKDSDGEPWPVQFLLEGFLVHVKFVELNFYSFSEAFRYTEELADRMQGCWLRAMKEAGFIDTSSDEDEEYVE